MKPLLILSVSLIPLIAQAQAPDCKGLGVIVSNLETDLQRSKLSDCQKVFLKDQLKAEEKLDPEIEEHFNGGRCEPLGKLEIDIQRLEGQLATLRALQEFSKDLSKKHQVLKNHPTTKEMNKAIVLQGQNLQAGLKTAYAMENLLTLKKPDFLIELQSRTSSGALTVRDFNEAYNALCATKKDECQEVDHIKNFLTDPAIIKEIGIVLKNSTLDSKGIDGLKNALKIAKKDGTPTSYGEIIQALHDKKVDLSKISSESPLEKSLILALKDIPDFETKGNLSFTESISKAKNALDTKATIDSYKYMAENVTLRNRMTQKSKMAAIINSISRGKTIPDEVKSACNTLLDPKTSPQDCLGKLEHFVGGLDQAYESDKLALSSIRALNESNDQIEKFQSLCLDEQQLINNAQTTQADSLLKDCKQSFISEEAILSKKLDALNLVRGKLLSENKHIQDFRNFAIQKLESNSCNKEGSSTVSTIGDCGTDIATGLTPSLNILTSDVLNVAILYKDFDDKTEAVAEYCESDKTKKTNDLSRLCEYISDDSLPNTPTLVSNNDDVSAPTEIDSRAGHDAKMNALQGAINNIAGALGQQNRTYYTPYNYYNPYLSNTPPMTISDSLTFNSVYYGGYSGYYPMANSSPFIYNSQLFGHMNSGTGTGSLYSYSASGASSSGYGISNFLPTFSF